jgi:hypothetical protein
MPADESATRYLRHRTTGTVIEVRAQREKAIRRGTSRVVRRTEAGSGRQVVVARVKGLSGRQWKKLRKRLRRQGQAPWAVPEEATAAPAR